MTDYIYKVYDGNVERAQVKKETKKLFFIERKSLFGFMGTINKEHACITPVEAVKENLNRCLERAGMFSDRHYEAVKQLEQAKNLAKEHGINNPLQPAIDYANSLDW